MIDPELLERLRALRDNPALLSDLTPEQLSDVQSLHRYALRESLDYFAEFVAPDFCKPHHDPRPARHHRLLLHWLNELARWDGTGKQGVKRLIITLPPGSAKSTYSARIFLAWVMMRNPFSECILTSASQSLVEEHSDRIQQLIGKYGHAFDVEVVGGRGDQAPAKGKWKASNKSSLLAVSAGTAFQGFRGDWILCDDIVGGVEDCSDVQRDKLWEWFTANLLGRLSDSLSRMLIICTRWHADDIVARILREKGEQDFVVINLPAIWEDEEPERPWPYGLGREIDPTLDEPLRDPRLLLWPEYHGFDRYDEARRGAELTFQALYQGKPVPAGGAMFQADKIHPAEGHRKPVKIVRAWDFAASKKRGADFTASVKMAVDSYGHYTILDRTKERLGPHEARTRVLDLAAQDGPQCVVAIPKDPGQAGTWQAADLVAALAGYVVEVYSQSGSKQDRAKPFAAQVNGENVSMLRGDWNRDFLDELRGFPNLAHDDQVDAAATAFGSLLALPTLVLEPSWSHWGGRMR